MPPGGARGWSTPFSLLLIGGAVLLGAVVVLGVVVGPVSITPGEVLRVVVQRLLPVPGLVEDPVVDTIVWDARLPRTLLAAVVGSALAVIGASLQTLVRNPLADPYVLGVSSGASLGAVTVLVLAPPVLASFSLSAAAFLGGLAAYGLVMMLAWSPSGVSPERLVLVGVTLSSVLSAATAYLIFQTRSNQAAQSVLSWLLGSLGGADWGDLRLPAAALAFGLVVLVAHAHHLDALAAGDDVAASLGVTPRPVRARLVVVTCLMTGTAVSVSGGIGFVGLVVPHLVRAVVGTRHGRVVPASALVGAVLLVAVDTLCRTIVAPQELPVGILTALVGAPVFFVVLRCRARTS